MNETSAALKHNYEAIDVFSSWTHENNRVKAKEIAFDSLWKNRDPSVNVVEFPPQIVLRSLRRIKREQQI